MDEAKLLTRELSDRGMQPARLAKRGGWTLVILSIVIISIGASMMESGGVILGYGDSSGEFTVEASLEGATLLVLEDADEGPPSTAECERVELTLFGPSGAPVTPEKADCMAWESGKTAYLYRLNALAAGTYSYQTNAEIEFIAVEGDVNEFLDAYATGTALEDAGAGMCCFGLLALLVARGLSARSNAVEGVVTAQTWGHGDSANLETVVDSTMSSQDQIVLPSQPDRSTSEVVSSSMYQAIVDQAESIENDAVDEPTPSGSFWGGITED